MIAYLSPRERAVARYLLGGWSYESIGYQLDIAPETVKQYGCSIARAAGKQGITAAILSILRCKESLGMVMEHPTYEP